MGRERLTLINPIQRKPNTDTKDIYVVGIVNSRNMATAPETITVDVSGASLLRILHNDPDNTLATTDQVIRIDWESSSNNGRTWSPEGADIFKGKYLGKASGHYVEIKAIKSEQFTDSGHLLTRIVPIVWPAGMLYRFHIRQLLSGRFGIDVELEK